MTSQQSISEPTTITKPTSAGPADPKDRVSWWEYGAAYDELCSINPHYEDNVSRFRQWCTGVELPANPVICDIGAGTGNYLLEAARAKPESQFYHWDWNSVMNDLAAAKYAEAGFEATFASQNISDFPGDIPPVDLAIAVNSLYTFPDSKAVISRIFDSIKPGGLLFTIDLGRELDTGSWARDLIAYNIKTRGFTETLKLTYRLRHAIKQNRKIDQSQDDGAYWAHTTTEFAATMERAGFVVERLETCYRDKCDLAVCRKPIVE